MKTRYHQYTDATFSVKEAVPDKEKHLGILGPVIRAEVGDEIKVVLLNRSPYPASLYLQGVTFDKSQDGLLQKKPFGKKLSFNCLLLFCNDWQSLWNVPKHQYYQQSFWMCRPIERMATVRNRYKYLTPFVQDTKGKATEIQSEHYKQKAKRIVSFPKNGQTAIQNKKFTRTYMQRRTMTEIVNHSRSTALDGQKKFYWGLYRFYVVTNRHDIGASIDLLADSFKMFFFVSTGMIVSFFN